MSPNRYLCSAPFTTLNVKPEGARPCCSRHAPAVSEELNSWWNGSYMRNLRRKMFAVESLPDYCRNCLAQGASSPARYSPSFDLKHYDSESGIVRIDPTDIYLFTGRECSLGCVMCDSYHSITHEHLFPARAKPSFDHQFIDPRGLVSKDRNRKYIISGGEPLLYRHYDELLELTVPHSRETAILTNGMHSVVRPRTVDLLDAHREKVVFVFSFDGAPEVNKKIRVNVDTARVLKHLLEARSRNWICDIHFTISTVNVSKFTEFVHYIRAQGLLNDPLLRLNVAAVIDPLDFNPSQLSTELKNEAIRQIDLMERLVEEWHLSDPWRTRLLEANQGVRDSLIA